MGIPRKSRRRCCGCRKWYRAHRSAIESQKTCSTPCRRKRLTALAKRRRELDLVKHREQERERQRSRRERQRSTLAIARDGARVTPVSRSGLPVQVVEAAQLILDIWDKSMVASRATLLAELRVALSKIPQIVGQAGTDQVACHAPAPTP